MPEVTVNTYIKPRFAPYLNPFTTARDCWRQRRLIGELLRRDIVARYRASFLGLVWLFLLPLLTLVVYTFAFHAVLNARFKTGADESTADFALALFAGLIVFNVFATSISRSSGLMANNVNYIKKVVFPLQALPIVTLLSTLVHETFSFGVLIVGLLVISHAVPATALFFPVIVIPLVMMSLGLCWLIASLGAFIPDVGQVITVGTRLLFYITPIFYDVSVVPESLRWISTYNPLAVLVVSARKILIFGESPEWVPLAIVFALSAAVLQVGYAWFMTSKRGFIDVF